MNLIRSLFLFGMFFFLSCSQVEDKVNIYLSNSGMGDYENLYFEISLDDKQVFSDSVRNQYLSFHWLEKELSTKRGDHKMQVVVSNDYFRLEKDTLIVVNDSVKVFVDFDFHPYYKRYDNPEIFRHFQGTTTRLKEIADSLYANNLLTNASEYLNDTVPLPENLSITIQ